MSDVGEIVGRLKLDDSDWNAKLDQAEAKARELGATDPKIRVTADTGGAITAMSAVQAKADAVAASEVAANDRVKASTDRVNTATQERVDWQKVLIGSLVAVAAAAPPVAAAAVGITGAFGAMGVAGVLAVTGIAREMKAGQGEGLAYAGIVNSLKSDLYGLQDSAAKGLLPGARQAVADLQVQMPALNMEMQHFGSQLGGLLPAGLDTVVTLLQRAEPLLDAGAGYLADFVDGLDGFAHSNAFGDFVNYAIENLPNVEEFLTELLHTAGDFLAAWAPLGAVTLPMLTDLVTGLDDVVKATGPLVPAAVMVAGAFSAWKGIAPVIAGITGALDLMGTSATAAGEKVVAAETAAEAGGAGGLLGKVGGLKGLGVTAGGVLAGGMIAAGTDGSGSMAGDLQGMAGGAIAGASIGRYAGPVGIGVGALIGATAGSIYANRNNYAGGATAGAQTATYDASWNGYAGATPSAKKASSTPNMGGGDTSYNGFGATVPDTSAISKKNTAAAQQNAAADIANTAAMQAQKLAATQLATGYGVLDGSIKVASSAAFTNVTSFNAAQEAVLAVGAALKQNKGAWSANTAAGLADRDAVASAVSAINAHAQAINADGQHSEQATEYTSSHISALVKEAEAAGISKGKITDYIATLLNIPKSEVTELLAEDKASAKANAAMQASHKFSIGKYESVLEANGVPADRATKLALSAAEKWAHTHATATLDADTKRALAAARYAAGQIDAMHASIQVTASVNDLGIAGHTRGNGTGFGVMAHGGTAGQSPYGPIHRAAFGTTVRGPGTAASDQAGTYRLANGEEVISDMWGGATAMRPFLKQVSAGNVKTKQQAANALGLNQQAPQIVLKTMAPEIHLHNPVAKDPVAQATEAAQLALAYAGIG